MKPFQIHFGEDDLRDLKARIGLDRKRLTTRHAEPLEGAAFDYGFNGHFLTEAVASYWMEKYDWIGEQKRLNAFPQFITSIDGLDVHFVHVKPDPVASKGKTVLPLLMVHGWPGSFVEFVKIIPLLTAPRFGLVWVAFAHLNRPPPLLVFPSSFLSFSRSLTRVPGTTRTLCLKSSLLPSRATGSRLPRRKPASTLPTAQTSSGSSCTAWAIRSFMLR